MSTPAPAESAPVRIRPTTLSDLDVVRLGEDGAAGWHRRVVTSLLDRECPARVDAGLETPFSGRAT